MLKALVKSVIGGFIGFLSAKAGWPVYSLEFWVTTAPVCIIIGLL